MLRDALGDAPDHDRGADRDRAVGLRAHGRHERHRSSSRSRSRAPRPTRTARSTWRAARGAVVVAIVNRRQSDLVDKSDGVLYTSDGRDVEMSVASTKAFYAQLAAGHLLALGAGDRARRRRRGRPGAAQRVARRVARPARPRCSEVFARRPAIALAAQRHSLSRRSWAVVGNGVNQIAAQELRIKLSELCYKSIACDVTEDKKHIDLSSEPMVLVCAAGLHGSNADDVAKEVAIYRAHKAAPDRDRRRRRDPLRVGRVRDDPGAVGAPVVGVRAVRARRSPVRLRSGRSRSTRRPDRCARRAGYIEALVGSAGTLDHDPLAALVADLEPLADRFFDGLRAGQLRRQPRSAHRGAARVDAALRGRRDPARRVPGRFRQGRHAERRGGGPHRRAHEGDRGARPARSTRSSTRPRRSRSASPAPTRRCCRSRSCARCSRRARPATASPTARCARWWRSTARSIR